MLPGGLARLMYGARDFLVQSVTGIDVRPRVADETEPAVLATAGRE
jgi:hypothetical protein